MSAEKTEIGNISWQKSYFNFSDAEDAIFKNWAAREGQPHYSVDKSYIGIYKFSELKKSESYEKEKIIEDLRSLLEAKLRKNIDGREVTKLSKRATLSKQ